jgi:hypothetical protein
LGGWRERIANHSRRHAFPGAGTAGREPGERLKAPTFLGNRNLKPVTLPFADILIENTKLSCSFRIQAFLAEIILVSSNNMSLK